MLFALTSRREARRFARQIRLSLQQMPDVWEPATIDIEGEVGERYAVVLNLEENGDQISLLMTLRRFRLFDRLVVIVNETEVWLPLVARIRTRAAVRWWTTQYAKKVWASMTHQDTV